jgi:arylsulfatase A-like enzyme
VRRSRFAGALSLEGRWAFLRRPGAWWLAALALGAAARVFFVLASEGTYDVGIWEGHARGVAERGLIDTYEHGNRFNHPPPIGLLIGFLHGLAARLGVDFAVLLRAPFALLDAGTALLLLRILRGHPARWALSALYWLHPLAILYSGYHGNTDSAVAFFLLGATVAATGTRGNRGAVAAGVCLGLGAWVKLPVVLGAPALFFALPGRGQRLRLAAAASVVALVGFAPALAEDAGRVVQSVFLYGGQNLQSTAGVKVWGLQNLWPEPASMPYAVRGGYAAFLAGLARWNALIATLPLLVLAWLRRGERSPAAVGATIGLCYATFYALTNAWAFQYFAWSLPCWLLLGRRSAWALSVAATLYIWALYMWLTGHPLLLGEWDFVGHRHWPFPILLLRDACVLVFLAVGAAGFGAALARTGRSAAGTAAGAALLACLGCGGPEVAPQKGLVLVTVDTLRSDHTSAYGYERDTTPTLRSIAARGALAEHAYAPSAVTAPSHASLFTARYPIAHGLVKNGLPLAEREQTLAEVLRDQGWSTAAIVSSFVLDRKFGFAQGFEHYEDDFDPANATLRVSEWEGHPVAEGFDRRARETTDRAVQWLEHRSPDRPFFLFVHYFDPHDPYAPPAAAGSPFRPRSATPRERAIALYDAEIRFVDGQLGRLIEALEELGLGSSTLLVVTSDHGEGLGDHDQMFHGLNIYEEAVRVPLLFRWPGRIPAGGRIAAPVELVDVAPTILDLLSVAHPPGFRGRSLARALGGEEALDPERPVFLQRRHFDGPPTGATGLRGDQFAIRAGRWKYIEAPEERRRELFDLELDRRETRNLLTSRPDSAARLHERLGEWRARHGGSNPPGATVSERDRARLEALGYAD